MHVKIRFGIVADLISVGSIEFLIQFMILDLIYVH